MKKRPYPVIGFCYLLLGPAVRYMVVGVDTETVYLCRLYDQEFMTTSISSFLRFARTPRLRGFSPMLWPQEKHTETERTTARMMGNVVLDLRRARVCI
jgi:hypothetical protein